MVESSALGSDIAELISNLTRVVSAVVLAVIRAMASARADSFHERRVRHSMGREASVGLYLVFEVRDGVREGMPRRI